MNAAALFLFPKEKILTGPGEGYLRPFFIYQNGAPFLQIDFCWFWEFLLYRHTLQIALESDIVISPFFGFWN